MESCEEADSPDPPNLPLVMIMQGLRNEPSDKVSDKVSWPGGRAGSNQNGGRPSPSPFRFVPGADKTAGAADLSRQYRPLSRTGRGMNPWKQLPTHQLSAIRHGAQMPGCIAWILPRSQIYGKGGARAVWLTIFQTWVLCDFCVLLRLPMI